MEYRKLVKFGAATYCVSLPKAWVREHKLQKGDLITIDEQGDGTLKVFAKDDGAAPVPKEITFDISGKAMSEVQRMVLVAYINDYSIINLRGDIAGRVKELRDIFQQFLALEVMDLTDERITAKAFLDITETNPLKVLRRVDTIVKTMFTDLQECCGKCKRSNCHLVAEKDLEINRLHYFAMKLINRGLNDVETARHWGLSQSELAFIMVLADKLEKIADRLKRLESVFSAGSLSEKEVHTLLGHSGGVEENYRAAMSSFYKNDTAAAHQVIERHEAVSEKQLDSMTFRCITNARARVGCGIPMVLEYLSRISVLTEDIARVVLDPHPEPAGAALVPKQGTALRV